MAEKLCRWVTKTDQGFYECRHPNAKAATDGEIFPEGTPSVRMYLVNELIQCRPANVAYTQSRDRYEGTEEEEKAVVAEYQQKCETYIAGS